MRLIKFGAIFRVLGVLFCIVALAQSLCLPVSFYYETGHASDFISSILMNLLIGALFLFWTRHSDKTLKKREGYLIVVLAWVSLWIASALPYILTGPFVSYTDLFFETISGLTTTGATVLDDIEALPRDILFWRSFTQWLGGMGVIVLTVALLPILGIGGIELFVAEVPGPTSEKLHPRIKDTAKALWNIYLWLTVLLFFLLWYSGMSGFDAINHALTTMATGGFSTHNESMAYFDTHIQYIVAVFMFLSGTTYSLLYLCFRGKFKEVLRSDELKAYLFLLLLFTAGVTLLSFRASGMTLTQAFHTSVFQVVSMITSTGFVTTDYTAWSPILTYIFFIMLFIGGCAGSTSGGIKIIRHTIMFKNSILEFKRLLHPRAMIRLKINKKIVPPRVMTHILVFFMLYIGTFIIGTLLVIASDVEFLTAAGAVATSLGNVGPGIGDVGPAHNFALLNDFSKWVLSWIMIIGRLELFTVFVVITPYFWRSN